MLSGISSTTINQSYSSGASSGGTDVATLKSQLATKEDEVKAAKTDEEKATLEAEVTELEAKIADANSSAPSSGQSSSPPSKPTGGKQDAPWAQAFQTADKAAAGSKFSSAAMDVLMRMPKGGAERAAEIYSKLDSNSDNSLTKEEFVQGRDERMTEEQASKRFTEMDAENKGSISKDQFTAGLAPGGVGGRPPMGPPPVNLEMPELR